MAASAVAFSISSGGALLQQPRRYAFRQVAEQVVGQDTRPFAVKHGERANRMSAEKFRRTFPEVIAAALRKRVGPGTGMTVKELSYALRIDQQTVWKLLNGYNSPSGPVLMALLTFFDASFANEILEPTGCTVAKLCDRQAAALRKVTEGMAELRAMGGR